MKTTEIDIYGQRYALKGDADEQYLKRVAAFVDEQMRTLARGMKTATPTKLAILTALNIAHQLFQAERVREEGDTDLERRTLTLVESIEEQLQIVRKS
ncbi:MAG TPA: cell division protein ZapA [Nitrospirales bacterium]|nr:cell division protein ZapA [Nitrospirales bacterium]